MNDADLDLFFAEMSDVTPLKKHNHISERETLTPTLGQLEKRKALMAEAEDDNPLADEYVDLVDPHDLLSFKKSGVQDGVFKNLRLGKYAIDATLDLHGMKVKVAREQVFRTLTDCHKRNVRVVLIRHGKGLKSTPFPALLKSYLNKWLQQLDFVLAFHSAQGFHGGSASTYALLRKSDEKKLENREKHAKK